MKVETIVVGPLKTNCYLLEKDSTWLIVDPGEEFSKIEEHITGNVFGILLTHRHFDHVGALASCLDRYQVPVYDASSPSKKIQLGSFSFEILATKGHTEDSISFYFPEEQKLFAGDFLFFRTVGRVDLPTGSKDAMKESIAKIKHYPDTLEVYPGHGPKTTLGEEKQENPYFTNMW